jgi:uncharacterized damage-inducible protein DinB
MSHEIADRCRRWFDYEKDAHQKVFRSLESVPTSRRSAPEYLRAVSILAHIVVARRVWLGRLGVAPAYTGPFFPQDLELAQVVTQWKETERLWSDFLAPLTDENLAKTFEYQSLDAGRFRNRIEDILAQLFGHSSYHRGQIAMLVRSAGGEPAITDLIYWCREKV